MDAPQGNYKQEQVLEKKCVQLAFRVFSSQIIKNSSWTNFCVETFHIDQIESDNEFSETWRAIS